MSWDALIIKLPEHVKSAGDLGWDGFEDFEEFEGELAPIGKLADIRARILEVAPAALFRYPDFAQIAGEGFSIDISLGSDPRHAPEECYAISFNITRPSAAFDTFAAIVNHLNMRVIDLQTDEILPLPLERSAVDSN